MQRLMAGEKPPFTWRKCLYLEWFSNANGRVVIMTQLSDAIQTTEPDEE